MRLLLLALMSLLTLDCSIFGSSPDPDFYVLFPDPGRSFEGPSLHIELRRPVLPDYLERPQIVRRVEHGQLALSEQERWGASLTNMVASTLATNLSQRLPRSQVYGESGAISATPDLWIEVDLRQFERTPEGEVVLSAQAALHWQAGGQRAIIQAFEQRQAPASDSTQATVAAMSALLGHLAEAIAQRVVAGPPPQPAAAPEGSTAPESPELGMREAHPAFAYP